SAPAASRRGSTVDRPSCALLCEGVDTLDLERFEVGLSPAIQHACDQHAAVRVVRGIRTGKPADLLDCEVHRLVWGNVDRGHGLAGARVRLQAYRLPKPLVAEGC